LKTTKVNYKNKYKNNMNDKFSGKFKETGRDDILWSALRVKFSRIENLRDGFPKARIASGIKQKRLASTIPIILPMNLGN